MIVMMIMMLPSNMRGGLKACRHWSFRRPGWAILLWNPADRAETVLHRILTTAGEAGARRGNLRGGAGRRIRVYLRSKPLNRLQSGCNRFVAGFGMIQVLLEAPEEIFDRGIMGQICLGSGRGRIPDRSGWFFTIHSATQRPFYSKSSAPKRNPSGWKTRSSLQFRSPRRCRSQVDNARSAPCPEWCGPRQVPRSQE